MENEGSAFCNLQSKRCEYWLHVSLREKEAAIDSYKYKFKACF